MDTKIRVQKNRLVISLLQFGILKALLLCYFKGSELATGPVWTSIKMFLFSLSLSISNLALAYSLEFGSFWHLWFQKMIPRSSLSAVSSVRALALFIPWCCSHNFPMASSSEVYWSWWSSWSGSFFKIHLATPTISDLPIQERDALLSHRWWDLPVRKQMGVGR